MGALIPSDKAVFLSYASEYAVATGMPGTPRSAAIAFSNVAGEAESAAAAREGYAKAEADARQAIALAPDLGLAHLALARVSENDLTFPQANTEYERALAQGNAQVLRLSGEFAVLMGRFDAGSQSCDLARALRAIIV